jgi:hypothetical protein
MTDKVLEALGLTEEDYIKLDNLPTEQRAKIVSEMVLAISMDEHMEITIKNKDYIYNIIMEAIRDAGK